MKFAFLTNIISPHQMPLARGLINLLGESEYRYVYIVIHHNVRNIRYLLDVFACEKYTFHTEKY